MDEQSADSTSLDEVLNDIRWELTLRAAKADRDEKRDLHTALENE